MELDIQTIQSILSQQFLHYQKFNIRKVETSGHDNNTYHLGDNFSLRFPSAIEYSTQVIKEHKYCKILQKSLSIQITEPLELGVPSSLFPFHFSINKWINGESVTHSNTNKKQLALDLAHFLIELKKCDTLDKPKPGDHNFYRGGSLLTYHDETMRAINRSSEFDKEKCLSIWNNGIDSVYTDLDVWIHGDLEINNLLVNDGKLCAVIDFGNMCVGDPACDYVMAWTYFDKESRRIFLEALNIDQGMIHRSKAWALWKALITLNDPMRRDNAYYTLNELINNSEEYL